MTDSISLPVSAFKPTEMYFLLRDSVIPRPIAWISTVNAAGQTNLAPFSFFNVCCPSPPVLGFSCGPRGDDHNSGAGAEKDTLLNIRANGEFVVNIAPESMFEKMVQSAQDLAHGESEFNFCGLSEATSTLVKPPRVLGAPIAFECKLHSINPLGLNTWIMGDIVHVHIAPENYQGRRGEQDHRVDLMEPINTRPMGRLGRANYVRLREIENLLRKDGPN
jgi:flavin reductase (DIM6/NTAB) family NADH-FMN oxidoreductase RutF